MRTRRQRAGFTLLEMLLAMGLMAMLAGALYASLSAGFRGRRAAEEALDPARRADAAMAMLGADLLSATPPTGLLAGEFTAQDARGEDGEPADELRFHALAPDQRGARPASPVRRVKFGIAADEETGETVLVRRTTVNLLAPQEPEPSVEVLARRVRSLDLAFYDGTAWLDSWDSTAVGDVLPVAVRVSIAVRVEGQEEGYALGRVFALPCGRAPGQGVGAAGFLEGGF